MKTELRSLVLAAIFAAAAAAGGFLLIAVPNVELYSIFLFLSGITLGIPKASMSAVAAGGIFFGFNPQGGLFPPLIISQILGSVGYATAGGLIRRRADVSPFICGLLGIAATALYDLLTNLAFPLSSGFVGTQIAATLVAGIPFAAVHIGSNALIFGLLTPPLRKVIDRSIRGLG